MEFNQTNVEVPALPLIQFPRALMKPDCFGQKFHEDLNCTCEFKDACYHAWLQESRKSPAQKASERTSKIVDLLAKSDALVEGIDRRESAQRWAKIEAQQDAEEKVFDEA